MQKLIARFEKLYERRGPDECWPWLGATVRDGRGQFWIDSKRKNAVAARVAWWISTGQFPEPGICVCHRCDNPPCVNPSHLFLGTKADNYHDGKRKGRMYQRPFELGENHHRAVLTTADVLDIFRRRKNGQATKSIARDLGCSEDAVRGVVKRVTWRHVAVPAELLEGER